MQYRKVKDIINLENNPRVIRKEDFKKLCDSIESNKNYFEARPVILSNRTGKLVVIAGNQRLKAAIHIGMDEVPTYLIEDLDEKSEREIIIRDNVSNGEWNWDLLANEWIEDELIQWGLDIPKFEEGTIEEDAEEQSFVKISIEATNETYIELSEKLQNLCDEYNVIMKVK